MGIGYRIKEARENLGLTQTELGQKVGVTGSAITNYEKETSHPKEQIIYKLMEVLGVDANYLFQDCVNIPLHTREVSISEYTIIEKYRKLSEDQQKFIKEIIDREYRQRPICMDGQYSLEVDENGDTVLSVYSNGKFETYPLTSCTLNAAHTIDESSEEDKKHDEEIMNGDNF